MFKAPYYKTDGSKGRARKLPAELFDGEVNESVLHQVVKAHLANQRQGTAAAKNRAAVAGGSRKPWRQKGTGRARQGTTRAAQWVGGGRAFPPQPHSWRQRIPRKVRALAHRSALNARAQADQVILIDTLSMDAPKTATIRDYLESIGAEGKVLILTEDLSTNVYLSARNLNGVEVRTFGEESTYDVLWAQTLVIERGALENAKAKAPAAEAPAAEADDTEASDGEEASDA